MDQSCKLQIGTLSDDLSDIQPNSRNLTIIEKSQPFRNATNSPVAQIEEIDTSNSNVVKHNILDDAAG